MALGITVPKVLVDFFMLQAGYETSCCALTVEDKVILKTQALLARKKEAFVCPEGAATLSAAIQLVQQWLIKLEERMVFLNTGTGPNYPETVQTEPPALHPEDDLPPQ